MPSTLPHKVDTPTMFSEIAHRYDLLNHMLSLNIDKRWRKRLVGAAAAAHGARILDACTGTADVAIEFAKAIPDSRVVGIDRSQGMLAVGRDKLVRSGLDDRVELCEGDVLDLPFDDGEFDAVTIAFGLRNLPDYARGVSEMARVLRPGGRLLVLEFAPPTHGLYLKAYNFYLQNLLPVIGGVVSGSWKAYRYLASSIGDFLPKDRILELMRAEGLANVGAQTMAGGITHIFCGEQKTGRGT